MKSADISGIKRENIWKTKLKSKQLTLRTRKSENCRGINTFKRSYKCRLNLQKDENGDVFANFKNILNLWKEYSSLLLNVDSDNEIKQIQIHATEPLIPDTNHLEVEIDNANLKNYKSFGSDRIPVALFQSWGGTLLTQTPKLIIFAWNKE
jgi:hypothetical protein